MDRTLASPHAEFAADTATFVRDIVARADNFQRRRGLLLLRFLRAQSHTLRSGRAVSLVSLDHSERGAQPKRVVLPSVQDQVTFGFDQAGDEVLMMRPSQPSGGSSVVPFKGANKVVMMRWEKEYMEACVHSLGITRNVREAVVLGTALPHPQLTVPRVPTWPTV